MKPVVILFIVPFALMDSASVDARTWYVPSECPTIQAGIDSASAGDVVEVADGTYTGSGNKNLDFGGKAITVRSENGPDNCIIDCEASTGDRHRGFRFHNAETAASVVEGFTIKNGYASFFGGGIYCGDSSPTIMNCTISENICDSYGGGISCDNSSPTIMNCTISENVGWDSGGGVYCTTHSNPMITNCTISENTAYYHGGGVYCVDSSSPTITNCTISGNLGWRYGGGISCAGGSLTITNCIISKNEAPSIGAGIGGGIHCVGGSPTITNCTISGNTARVVGGGIKCIGSNPTITNCTISENYTNDYSGYGGGISCDDSNPTITNCTISENYTIDYGGGISCDNSNPTITNCILWENMPEEIHVFSGAPVVTYSDIEGGWPGEGNIEADPLFVCHPDTCDTADFHLRWSSPCIDAGDNAAVPPGVTTDLDGNPRIINGDGECPAIVDMGAYEFQLDAECEVSPTSLNFGTLFIGNYLEETFTITNTGGDTLSGTVTESCQHYSTVSGGGTYNLAGCESVTVTVRFEPDTAGQHDCTIETGTALCSDVLCTGVGEYPTSCQVSPTNLNFDTVCVSESLNTTFTITNTGGGTLSGNVSESCAHFSLVGSTNYNLTAGQQKTFTVRFEPQSAGTKYCTIETGNGLCSDVSCTGTGSTATAVELSSFTATGYENHVEVEWTTAAEIDNAGFNLHRGLSKEGPYAQINDQMIPAMGSTIEGATYSFTDEDVTAGETYYYYWLEDVDVYGRSAMHGPVFATPGQSSVRGEEETPLPTTFTLAQNNPNPFNPITEIKYALPKESWVKLEIYNLLGQKVASLVDEPQKAGYRSVHWDANSFASGIYFYHLQAGDFVETRKMILLR